MDFIVNRGWLKTPSAWGWRDGWASEVSESQTFLVCLFSQPDSTQFKKAEVSSFKHGWAALFMQQLLLFVLKRSHTRLLQSTMSFEVIEPGLMWPLFLKRCQRLAQPLEFQSQEEILCPHTHNYHGRQQLIQFWQLSYRTLLNHG